MKSETGITLFDLRSTRMRLATESDYELLYRWQHETGEIHSLSFHPSTRVFSDFVRQLDELQRNSLFLLIVSKADDAIVGYLMTYQVDLWNGWAHIGMYGAPEQPIRWYYTIEPMRHFVDFLFQRYPFRKLYVEIYDFADALTTFLTARGWIEESFLPDHYRHGQNFAGVRKLALRREAWQGRTYRRRGLRGD